MNDDRKMARRAVSAVDGEPAHVQQRHGCGLSYRYLRRSTGILVEKGGGAARSWEWKFRSPWALIHWCADMTGCSSITRARLDKASDALQGGRAGLRSGASRRVWIWTRWAGSLLYGYGSFPAVGNKRDRDGFNTTHARHASKPGTSKLRQKLASELSWQARPAGRHSRARAARARKRWRWMHELDRSRRRPAEAAPRRRRHCQEQ